LNACCNPSIFLVQGAAREFEESIASAAVLLLVTVFTIYILLGMLYESFIHPLIILSTLPPAIVGGLMIFGICDYCWNGRLAADHAIFNPRDLFVSRTV
jgi:multidrug efflux pump subunit AcrB